MGEMIPRPTWLIMIIVPPVVAITVAAYIIIFPGNSQKKPKAKPVLVPIAENDKSDFVYGRPLIMPLWLQRVLNNQFDVRSNKSDNIFQFLIF